MSKTWTVGSEKEYDTYSANMVFEGDRTVAQVYGLPQNVTLREVEADPRYAEALATARLIASAPTIKAERDRAVALLRELAEDTGACPRNGHTDEWTEAEAFTRHQNKASAFLKEVDHA